MPVLDWIGKDKVVNHHLDVPYRVLNRQYSFDKEGQHREDNGSENMIIHGDNLEALKSLLPQYEGKIDCIYIDPPYNTGNQKWVYNDNVNDPIIQKWLGKIVGENIDDLTSHDKWLCMMYPRIKLLWKLLSEHGVILISINDYEYANLKNICDEIFTQKNLVNTFIWYIDGHTDNQEKITQVHEYVLCYAKDKTKMNINNIVDPNTPQDSKILNDFAENSITKNGIKNPPSEILLPVGFPCEKEQLNLKKHEMVNDLIKDSNENGCITREMTKKYSITYPARINDMVVENYALKNDCRVFSGWANNGKLKKFIDNGFQPFEEKGSTMRFYLSKNGVIYYRKEGRSKHYVQTVLENMGTTETNKYMLESMGIDFDYPKPLILIEYLLSIFCPKKGIVLDSFAGSGTTGHAIIENNYNKKEDNRFILIEMMDYAETKTARRIKSVIKGYKKDKEIFKGIDCSFSYYELGETLLQNGLINEAVDTNKIREYVYFTETKQKIEKTKADEPYLLGTYAGNAYYFYYDKDSMTTLDREFLHTVKTKSESYVIYADLCTLSDRELEKYHIVFKKIPRDISKL